MRSLKARRLRLALTCLLALPLAAQDDAPGADYTAFVGARILPVVGEPIDDAVLLIHGAHIEELGPRSELAVPEGATLIDARGMWIVPGLVDTHSHIGGPAAADGSSPIQPGVRVLDSLDARDPGFRRALAGGLTTLNVMPGSGHLCSGQTLYLKLRGGETIDDLLLYRPDGAVAGGLKMANGTNSRRNPPFPGTRGKSAALVREVFLEAQEYQAALARAEAGEGDPPPRDLDLECLVEVLEGVRIVHHHTHRHDDILTVLRLAQEFGFRVVLHHVSDAWKVAEEIAEAGVPSSLILVDSPGGKLEARDMAWENGAALERVGAPVAFHTDDGITDSRLFFRMAALGIRAGMSREGALAALTIEGARMLDLEERVGSLEPGKDADFVLLDGDPFSIYTHVQQTWVEGRLVFDLSRPEDRLLATGGWGATTGAHTEFGCCLEEETR